MSSVASPPRPHAPRHRHRRRAMHGDLGARIKRASCCAALAVLTTIVCVVLSTTCTTHGCTRRHGELADGGKGKGKGKGKRESEKTPRSAPAQGRKIRAAVSTYATLQRAGVILEERTGAQVCHRGLEP